tara:strand:+ start:708 stop:1109 length:402 start_codon:yes stop_codon:yes gene_type:complete
MGMIGRLFGTDKAVDNILDKDNGLLTQVGGWIGGLKHTEEEKAEDAQATRQWGLKQLEALEPFKVVQRILAFAAASLWIIVGLNVLLGIWFANPVTIQHLKEFAMSDYIFWPVISVFSLYFSGGVVNSLRKKS